MHKPFKAAEMFSVLADTTPDVTHIDRISCAVRFVACDGYPRKWLIEVKEIKDKKGVGHAKAILQMVEKKGLDSELIAFQSYDFAAMMSGVYKGAQAMLSKVVGREIPYIPYQGHRSKAVVEHSTNASPLVTSFFTHLESLYVFLLEAQKGMKQSLRNSKV